MGGLKPSVIFTPDSVAPQLVDTTTRRSIRLTAAEARVLTKFDGSQTAKELALWAAGEGLAMGPLQVQVVLERLEHAGYLLAAPHVPPQDVRDVTFSANEDRLEPTHIVPSMRNDLRIVPTPGSRSTFHVSDPTAHRAFTLFDFEVSIVRMLDGRRTAAQVVEAAAQIGITVTVDSLRRFLLQLKAFKCLSAEPTKVKPGPQATWPMRAEWTEDLRQLFQNALRLLRSNRFKESREFLMAMLEIDPMNKEAQEFKARVDELMRDPITELQFGDLHREPASSTGALLDSNLRVAVALPPDGVEVTSLPIGVRPTAPELPAQHEPVSIDLLPEIPDATPMEPDAVALEPVVGEEVPIEEPAPIEDEPPPAIDPLFAPDPPLARPMSSAPYEPPPPSLPPAPPVLMPSRDPIEPVAAPEPSAPSVRESIISDTIFAPPPSAPKPFSSISADSLAAALPSTSIVVDGIEPEIIPPAAMSPPIVAKAPVEPEPADEPKPVKRKGGPRRAVIAFLLVAIAVLLAIPLPRSKTVPCELSQLQLATVVAPRPGTIDQLPVTEGQVVEKGQLLATLSAKETEAQLEHAKTKVAAMERQLEQMAKSVKPAEVEKAKAQLAEKTKELNQATEKKRKLEAKHSPPPAIAKVEKDLRAKQKDVDKATEELDKVSKESKLSSGRTVLEGVKRQQAQLESELDASKIVAPEAGKIEGLAAAGATLAADATVARLVAPGKLNLVAKDPQLSASIAPGSGTVTTSNGAQWIVSNLVREKDGDLAGTLEAKDVGPGPAKLTLALGKRSWALDLIERVKQRMH